MSNKISYLNLYLDIKFELTAHKHRNATNLSESIGKAVPLQAWTGPEGARKLRFTDFVTTAQDGGKLSALRTGPLPLGNTPGTHFC